MTRLPRRLALLVASTLVALTLAEGAARVAGVSYPVFVQADPVLGLAHIPGASGWFTHEGRAWVEIESHGLRGPEVVAKREGTVRIALLGDSMVEALQVPFEATVGEVAAARLGSHGIPAEVLNFGVGGYGTSQQLLSLDARVWPLHPDIVLATVTTGNDISDNRRELKRVSYVPYHRLVEGRLDLDESFRQSAEYRDRSGVIARLTQLVLPRSRVLQLLNELRYGARVRDRASATHGGPEPGMADEVYRPPVNADWTEAWAVTEAVLLEMNQQCQKRGVGFAVVTLSNARQVAPDAAAIAAEEARLGVPTLLYPDDRIAAFAVENGIPTLSLAPILAAEARQSGVHPHGFPEDPGRGHWNQTGHRVAGEALAEWLAPRLPGLLAADQPKRTE